MVTSMRPRGLIVGVWAVTALTFFALILFVFLKVPEAQAQAGGLAQKIFYFHVPAAYALYLCGGVCFIGSAMYLAGPSDAQFMLITVTGDISAADFAQAWHAAIASDAPARALMGMLCQADVMQAGAEGQIVGQASLLAG